MVITDEELEMLAREWRHTRETILKATDYYIAGYRACEEPKDKEIADLKLEIEWLKKPEQERNFIIAMNRQ